MSYQSRGVAYTPHGISTHPLPVIFQHARLGMPRNERLARLLQRRIVVHGGFPRGRSYPWHVDVGDRWRVLHWEIARVLQLGAATLRIYRDGHAVNMDDEVPIAAEGPLQIELRRLPPDLQNRERSRSRDPDYVESSDDDTHGVHSLNDVDMHPRDLLPTTPNMAEDEDRIDLCSRTSTRKWYLPLYLQDFPLAASWEEANAAEAELTLKHVYKPSLDKVERLTIALHGRCLREGDNLSALAQVGEGQVVPQWQPGLGASLRSPRKIIQKCSWQGCVQEPLSHLESVFLQWF